MNTTTNPVQAEDVFSVGSRISWSAILAGAVVALAFQFLFGILGATIVGPMTDRTDPPTFNTAAVIWTIVVACISMFAGGMVSTVLTTGENKTESVLYGIIVWATVLAIVAHGLAETASGMSFDMRTGALPRDWERGAREAGVSQKQIDQWRDSASPEQKTSDADREILNRYAWWGFAGMWLSLFAATGGALAGAGPTFRLIAFPPNRSPLIQ